MVTLLWAWAGVGRGDGRNWASCLLSPSRRTGAHSQGNSAAFRGRQRKRQRKSERQRGGEGKRERAQRGLCLLHCRLHSHLIVIRRPIQDTKGYPMRFSPKCLKNLVLTAPGPPADAQPALVISSTESYLPTPALTLAVASSSKRLRSGGQ